jgi:two-component system LytT family response regulator
MQSSTRSEAKAAVAPARVLIIDDEPHARRYLRQMLMSEPLIEVVGESANGVEGSAQIRELSPDIVFADIQMPDLDGFGVIESGGRIPAPAFIFVTAYSEYAVKAFEIDVVDYVCKPFDRERLCLSLERARRRLSSAVREVGKNQWLSRLSIKGDEQIVFVPVEEVIWIESANKYVVIHTAAGSHILRQTIRGLEERLDPREFVRTHRSTLVRKAAVRGLQPLFRGDYIVKLVNGAEVALSRTFRELFFREMSR